MTHSAKLDDSRRKQCGTCTEASQPPTASSADSSNGVIFKIDGLDCAEEVAILKREIGPLVGGETHLSFDILNGRMTLLPDGKPASVKTIQKAVASTGMRATPWSRDREQPESSRKQRSHMVYTTLSGLSILVGIVLHIWLAGGWSDALHFFSNPAAWAVGWTDLVDYLESLFTAHAGQPTPLPEKIAYALAILFGGRYVIVKAWYAARRLRPDMNLLMTIAVVGAIIINEWFEAATVTFLFALSLTIESWSVGRARRAVEALLDLAPSTVRLKDAVGRERIVPATEVPVGACFVVAPGERIPLDGKITAGTSSVNQAPITGESVAVSKQPRDDVFAGTINNEGTLEIRATKPASGTTLARIIRMVEEAHSRRARTEQWVEKFARIYTPTVIILALGVFIVPPLLFDGRWDDWFYRALVLLVIACPCALVISTPVSIVAALACAARHGVLVKGGMYIEMPAHLKAIAFDKTGTLTRGEPSVVGIYPFDGHTEQELLARSAALESRSTHPLAQAITDYAANQGVKPAAAEKITVLPGKGVTGLFDGTPFWLGSRRYLLERGQETSEVSQLALQLEQTGRTVIAVGNDQHVCGLIAVADEPRDHTKPIMQALRNQGIQHLVMLTGDNYVTAQSVGARTGVDEIRAELLPADKVDAVTTLVEQYGTVAMVGDGINDAPALGRASLGIAMGAIGSDAAIETADIALMGDDLSKIPWLIGHSKRTLSVIRQNIVFALATKIAVAGLALVGLATLWEAIAADVGASLLVVGNGLRLLRSRRKR
jgi:Zn2+/Cd2+-exporting ATPase